MSGGDTARWALFLVLVVQLCAWGQDATVRTLEGNRTPVYAIAFSPDGTVLASTDGYADYAIRLWNVETGKVFRTLEGHEDTIRSVVFSPDGTTLASASYDRTVRVWDVTAGRQLRILEGHTTVYTVAFSPDGKTLASGLYDRTIKLWDLATGREVRTLVGHNSWVHMVAFSPDGRTLASAGSVDRTVKLWNVATGRELHTLVAHDAGVYAVAFTPDGRALASSSWRTIKLWDVATGRELRTFEGHGDWVYAVAFSPDGNVLGSGSADRTIRLWDVTTGVEQAMLRGHTGLIHSVAFSPTSHTIASGSEDSTIKLWDVSEVLHPNEPPVARFTFSPTQPSMLDAVRFTDASTDPDGEVVEWWWDFGDGQTSTERNPSHQYVKKDTFAVRLKVTDDDGATGTSSKEITIVNAPPEAAFGFRPTKLRVWEKTVFDASASTDPDGEIVCYMWDFGDGVGKEGQVVTHVYTSPGHYTVLLTITDDEGAHSATSRRVHVEVRPPEARFTYIPHTKDRGALTVGREAIFDASASTSPDSTIVHYVWDFGDGVETLGQVVMHTYAEPGTYTVELLVIDTSGATDTVEREVHVMGGGGGGPV